MRRRPVARATIGSRSQTNAPSPSGYGRHARNEKGPGVVAIGRDRNFWETRRRKNGSLYWARLPKNIEIVDYRPRKPRVRKLKPRVQTEPSAIDAPCRYTGKEPSPKGFGHCAHNQTGPGIVMRGRDGNMWETKRRVNGSLYWARRRIGRVRK